MTGSHSRLGTSDRESRTTGVIRAYDTGALRVLLPFRVPFRVPAFRLSQLSHGEPTKTSWELQPGVKFQRAYSSIPADSASYAVIHAAEVFFQTVHHYTHLPWCGVIVLTTIVLHSLVTLPLAIHQNKIITKMELLMPTLKEYQEAVKHTQQKHLGYFNHILGCLSCSSVTKECYSIGFFESSLLRSFFSSIS